MPLSGHRLMVVVEHLIKVTNSKARTTVSNFTFTYFIFKWPNLPELTSISKYQGELKQLVVE